MLLGPHHPLAPSAGRCGVVHCTRPLSALPSTPITHAAKRRRVLLLVGAPTPTAPAPPPARTLVAVAVATAVAAPALSYRSRSPSPGARTPLLLPAGGSGRELTACLGRCESEREVALLLEAWCRRPQQEQGRRRPLSSPRSSSLSSSAADGPGDYTAPRLNAVHVVAALTRLATLRQRREQLEGGGAGGWVSKGGGLFSGGRDNNGGAAAFPRPTGPLSPTRGLVASLLSPALAAAAISGSLDARGAANAAWALARLGEGEGGDDDGGGGVRGGGDISAVDPPPELLAALAALAPRSFAEPRHHSMALWAVGRWERRRRSRRREGEDGEGQQPPPLLPRGALSAWLPRAAAALFSAPSSSPPQPQAVANALHAVAELACDGNDDGEAAVAGTDFAAAFLDSSNPLPPFSPQQAACSARALALLLGGSSRRPSEGWVASWLAATGSPLLARSGPQAMSLLAWALPALLPVALAGGDDEDEDEDEDNAGDAEAATSSSPRLLDAALDRWLAAFQRHSEPLLPAFDDQALGVTCSALAKVAAWRQRRRQQKRRGQASSGESDAAGGSDSDSGGDGGGVVSRQWLSALERATLPRLQRMPPASLAPTLAGAVRLARLSLSAAAWSSSSPSSPFPLSARWLSAAAAASAPLLPAASDAELRGVLTAVALGGRAALQSHERQQQQQHERQDPLSSCSSSAAGPPPLFLPGAAWRALCHRELAARLPRMGAPRELLSVAGALLALDLHGPAAAAAAEAEADAGAPPPPPPPPPPPALVRAIAERLEAWLCSESVAQGGSSASARDVALAAWLVARLERQQRKHHEAAGLAPPPPLAPPSFWAAALRAAAAASSPGPLAPADASRLLWAVAAGSAARQQQHHQQHGQEGGPSSLPPPPPPPPPQPDAELLLPVVGAAGAGLVCAWRRQQQPPSTVSSCSPLDATGDVFDALARLGFYPGGAWLRAFFAASAAPALERAAEAERAARRRPSSRRRGARRSLARIARALSALGAHDAAPPGWCAGWARAWRGCEPGDDDTREDGPAAVAALLERADANQCL